MTAEIAIINRSGIAVAADSAATIGRKKVWKSANKLFSLGPTHDVGIMFYGSADLFGCHWEIIVKQFRESISNSLFKSIEEVSDAFIKFINLKQWNDERSAQIASAHLIAMCLEQIKSGIKYDSAMEFRDEVKAESARLVEAISDKDLISHVSKKDFLAEYSDIIQKFSSEIFEQKIVKKVLNSVENYIFEFSRRADCKSGYETGIVIFGYGEDEMYPSLTELVVDGEISGAIRTWSPRNQNLNKNRQQKGVIIPFAQTDVAALVMEGISPMYISFFMSTIDKILSAKDESYKDLISEDERVVELALRDRENDEIIKKVAEAFFKMRQREVISPVMESIHSLPRDEMAAMAEAFVELTSMRRKVDSHLDTVGGAVDVAVISKGEGFVWIKRKTYFDAKDNPDYLMRKRYRLRRGAA